jgi:hypothetical protein
MLDRVTLSLRIALKINMCQTAPCLGFVCDWPFECRQSNQYRLPAEIGEFTMRYTIDKKYWTWGIPSHQSPCSNHICDCIQTVSHCQNIRVFLIVLIILTFDEMGNYFILLNIFLSLHYFGVVTTIDTLDWYAMESLYWLRFLGSIRNALQLFLIS